MTTRAEYPYFQTITTRWKDNDIYGHVNNVDYYGFFDTVINGYLIRVAGLDIHADANIGLCVESHCRFDAPLQYPRDVQAGMRVAKLGTSSVRYELALFDQEAQTPAAEGWFVHVFVDRHARRPAALSTQLRAALQRLMREGQ